MEMSTEGILQVLQQCYQKDPGSLRLEADSLADDPLCWLMSNFELQVHELENLRSLPEDLLQTAGWCLAATILSRVPIQLSVADYDGNPAGFLHLALSFSFAAAPEATGVPTLQQGSCTIKWPRGD